MKESIQSHNDYAVNVLLKLKRAYFKKCQDAEARASRVSALVLWSVRSPVNLQDHKLVALSGASHAKSDLRHTETQDQHCCDPATRSVVTSPQPLRPLEHRASTGVTTTRPISLSSTLSNIASHGQLHLIHPTLMLSLTFRQETA